MMKKNRSVYAKDAVSLSQRQNLEAAPNYITVFNVKLRLKA